MFESFYHYFKNHTWELTEQWFKTLSDSKSGVYALQGEEQINKLKNRIMLFMRFFQSYLITTSTALNPNLKNGSNMWLLIKLI